MNAALIFQHNELRRVQMNLNYGKAIRGIFALAVALSIFSSVGWTQGRDIAAILGYPQTIVYNAKIVSVTDASFSNELGPIVQAMAIRDGKILATGTNAEMRALAGPQTELVDLKGRTVLPGFVLVHNHPMDWASVIPAIVNNTVPPDILVNRAIYGQPLEQYAKAEQVIKEAAAAAKPGAWLHILFVWDLSQASDDPNTRWAAKRITKEQLDSWAPNNPLLLRSREAILRQGREEMLNQRAVEVLDKTEIPDRPEVKASAVSAAKNGLPRGAIYRTMFPEIVFKNRPDLWAEIIRKDLEWWAAKGQTAFGSFLYHYPNIIKAFRTLDRDGRLPGRVAWGYGAIPAAAVKRDFQDPFLVADLANRDGTGTDYMWYMGTGTGGDDAGGCTTLSPRGSRQPDQPRPATLPQGGGCTVGFQPGSPAWNLVKAGGRFMAGHQWGDAGMDMILTMIKQASKEGGLTPEQIRSKRHVADHMNGWPRPDQIPILKELGMITGGTNMYISGGSAMWLKEYGEQSVEWVVPRGALVKAGVMSGIELDKPIELTDQNTFIDLYWEIQRKGQDGKIYAPDQQISRELALKTATIWGAYYLLKEKQLGSLEKGSFADFLVLDRDYLTIPQDDIPNIRILMTAVGGKVVHLVPSLAKELGKRPAGAAVELGGVEGKW
jgi:predicted amidohydrolase YtcJ